ncbi:MAG: biotin--[acetyl-CoA-carboxylase] ligase [Pyrinomonas sp.]
MSSIFDSYSRLMRFPPVIIRYDRIASTNTEAAEQARRGAPEGVCIVARAQTSGRGRQGRTWASPPDAGLYFSIILRPTVEERWWPLISLIGALAARDALRIVCSVEADIKWPNDLLINGKKICGVLAETVEAEGGRACVLGVGINLRSIGWPTELAASATSVEAETGAVPDGERLLQALINALDAWYALLHTETGPEAIRRAWEHRSSYAFGKRVRVAVEGRTVQGTTRGLEPTGALRLETESGEMLHLYSAEIMELRELETGGDPDSRRSDPG